MKKYLRDGRAPIPKKESTSRVMSSNRGRNTEPELILRGILRKEGIVGARFNLKSVIGRPDIVFLKKRLAIFVHGCFWHRCQYCKNSLPRTHRSFWIKKFKANKERDKRKIKLLKNDGWRVLVVWEHEIKKDPVRAIKRFKKILRTR